jgi:hypothetical protein
MNSVFLSYRRTDSGDVAGRLFDHLSNRIGKENIFKDVDSIPLGSDFPAAIEKAVSSCSAMVSLIGTTWLSCQDESGRRRLDNSEDYVRIELSTALKRGIPVIPVLIGGAVLPKAKDLPDEIHALSFRQGMPLRADPDFQNDSTRLIEALEACVGRVQQNRTLQDSFHFAIELQPMSGAKRTDLGEPHGIAYLGGCRFSITLANSGQTPFVISSMKAEVKWQELPPLALKKEERRYGGLLIPHQLNFELLRDGWSGWWMLSLGDKLSDTPRGFTNRSADLFDSPGLPRVAFRIGPQESELIEGSILPKDDGIYSVRIFALASDATLQKAARATNGIRVAKARLV